MTEDEYAVPENDSWLEERNEEALRSREDEDHYRGDPREAGEEENGTNG